mmetsp:Transcript_16802/g.38416  ORF Transcript_16802/g.38416 Transcript_16802/m.38416 type:complete len:266 (-) Transcript_16802:94-891(-)
MRSESNENIPFRRVWNDRNVDEVGLATQEGGPSKTKESTGTRSPKLPGYWGTLLNHSFSSTFRETIENQPVYAVHSTPTALASEIVKNILDGSNKAQHARTFVGNDPTMPTFVKDDPSGDYSEGDYYSDSEEGIYNTLAAKGCSGSSGLDSSIDSHYVRYYDEYDPFDAAEKIPDVFSETANIPVPKHSEISGIGECCLCNESGTDTSDRQPTLSDISDSLETIYYDTHDVKVLVGLESTHEAIEVSDSLDTAYYTIPGFVYNVD